MPFDIQRWWHEFLASFRMEETEINEALMEARRTFIHLYAHGQQPAAPYIYGLSTDERRVVLVQGNLAAGIYCALAREGGGMNIYLLGQNPSRKLVGYVFAGVYTPV